MDTVTERDMALAMAKVSGRRASWTSSDILRWAVWESYIAISAQKNNLPSSLGLERRFTMVA